MLNKYDGYTVGPNLRQLRKDKKLSVYQVSELTGLSNSSINQIEQGGRGLSMNGLYLLMDAYQCDANKLLNIEEFKEARRVINGTDANTMIASYAKKFVECIKLTKI